MNKNLSNEELANAIADSTGHDLGCLLEMARERLGNDGHLYCVSSAAMLRLVFLNKHPDLKAIWLREIRERLLNLGNENAVALFDVRCEDDLAVPHFNRSPFSAVSV